MSDDLADPERLRATADEGVINWVTGADESALLSAAANEIERLRERLNEASAGVRLLAEESIKRAWIGEATEAPMTEDDRIAVLRVLAESMEKDSYPGSPLVAEAADEIERLRAMVAGAPPSALSRCRAECPHSRMWECERPVGHQGPHIAPIDHVEWEDTDG